MDKQAPFDDKLPLGGLAFITGSHSYGTPKSDSDVDLVVRCTPEVADFLSRSLAEDSEVDYGDGCRQFKVGGLNLILATDDQRYRAWAHGTAVLRGEAPVDRDRAVAVFKTLGVGGLELRAPSESNDVEVAFNG